ncbi:MAG TPA: heparinase II/III family protein [Verrucomicrobiae bacterium]|nr:heparinase II/III family protein [Verrucomicrobiae bacterium]
MSPSEITLRLQKKAHQIADARYHPRHDLALDPIDCFPLRPKREDAPGELLVLLERNVDEILRSQWKAFGHLPMTLSDPPAWQYDNLAEVTRKSSKPFFKLDHRAQPNGADIKVIWEPNRWYQLVRLAMAAWLLDHGRAQEKCIEWLHHWARDNPPFTGLNWTSGLETGIRLVQYTWIDSFLCAAGVPHKTLDELRGQILTPHLWYTWRYKSFGSSANNHLIGELAGIILALVRWPELSKISSPLKNVAAIWEREVLAQFAEDGGNNEQALGYHLFSWEFCWQTQRALQSAGYEVSKSVGERIIRAGEFYCQIKPEDDVWDFGDSDNAFVTPLFDQETNAAREWWRWFNDSDSSPALKFWWGDFCPEGTTESRGSAVPSGLQVSSHSKPGVETPDYSRLSLRDKDARRRTLGSSLPAGWVVFPDSGYAIFHSEDWFARFDFSALGYLSMAPHGHLDALHVSIWFRGEPVIIDPGTGAYYAEKEIRNYLAGWSAHNSPHLRNPPVDFPRRLGVFLWGLPHEQPTFKEISAHEILAEVPLPYGRVSRALTFVPETNLFRITDRFAHPDNPSPVVSRWKFPTESHLKTIGTGDLLLNARGCSIRLRTSSWPMARSYNPPHELSRDTFSTSRPLQNVPTECIVSPAFRSLAAAPYLILEANGEGPFELTISPG